jgi:hypothetical protein
MEACPRQVRATERTVQSVSRTYVFPWARFTDASLPQLRHIVRRQVGYCGSSIRMHGLT